MLGFWLFVTALCVRSLQVAVAECQSEDCSPNYEPMPNIHAAMHGYNILKGNPVSGDDNIDPGTFGLEYIFAPTKKNDQDRYLLHDGVIVQSTVNCDLKQQDEIISNSRQYQESMLKTSSVGNEIATNLEYDVCAKIPLKGAEVSVGTKVPPLVSAAFQANDQVKENEEFFSKRTGILASSSATCTSYTVKISQLKPPPFHSSFLEMITKLQDATESDDGAKDRAFDKLIKNFGTHYFKTVVMGSRITVTERLTRDETSKLNQGELEECSKKNLNLLFGLIKDSSSQCKKVFKSDSSQVLNEYRRRIITTYGSKPANSLVEWSNQNMNAPLPIKMQLDPILNLFRDSFMGSIKDNKDREIDIDAIIKWMGPKYLRYCDDNKDELGVQTCNVHDMKQKGCGINDDCGLDQECKTVKSELGYKCIDPEKKYQISVVTKNDGLAGTDSNIYISLVDIFNRETGRIRIDNANNNFEAGATDRFDVKTKVRLDSLYKVILYKDRSGPNPGWLPDRVEVRDVRRDREYEFPCGRWFYYGSYSCIEKTKKTRWNSKKKKFTKIVRKNKKW
eukprot:gene15791-17384_t